MGGGKFLKILINWGGGVKNKCGGGNFLKKYPIQQEAHVV